MDTDYQLTTQNETLRQQLAEANARLRQQAVAEAQAKIDKLAADQAAADAAHKVAANRAAAAELEVHRRSAWLHHRSEIAQAAGPKAFMELLLQKDLLAGIPETAWPPNDGPDNYRVTGIVIPEPDEPVDDLSGTLLGKALAKRGVKI